MVSVLKNIKAKDPILIAAWPGMGQVALNAAGFLREKLKATLFAEIKGGAFFYPKDIQISDGVLDINRVPQDRFYFWENKTGPQDLIIFTSEQQPPLEKSLTYVQMILDFALSLKVKKILMFAALLTPMDYSETPKVWVAATAKDLISEFQKCQIKPLSSGAVSGLNGLFLGAAKEQKLNGACLLGEIPFYMSQIENPRASMAILEALAKYLGISIDLTDLIVADSLIMEEIGKLMEHMQEPETELAENPITPDDIENIKLGLETLNRIPDSAKKQIEELFLQAQKDISFAHKLKKKLDEWHAYKEYEDRFLSLFKREAKNDN